MTVKVLIVDDSAIIRQVFENGLSKDPEIEVVGTAPDPFIARDKILALKPDVITLDIEMPKMDGITFLSRLMKYYPIPVIICSTLTKQSSPAAIAAIQAGAVDVMTKPSGNLKLEEALIELREKVKGAINVDLQKIQRIAQSSPTSLSPIPQVVCAYTKYLLIGASTGGTQAIETLVKQFPENCPPTVIVQHMPPGFTAAFADRLNGIYKPEVKEAAEGDEVKVGRILIAPGHSHVMLKKEGARLTCHLNAGPLVNRHRPSVEVLFNSGAIVLKERAVGVMLTGMGADGAQGMLKLRQSGAYTIAQNEESCVVFGMPRAAIEAGAACDVMHLDKIALASINACQGKVTTS